jgi:hypothetical protein
MELMAFVLVLVVLALSFAGSYGLYLLCVVGLQGKEPAPAMARAVSVERSKGVERFRRR